VEPQVAQPGAVQVRVARPDVVRPDVVRPGLVGSGSVEPAAESGAVAEVAGAGSSPGKGAQGRPGAGAQERSDAGSDEPPDSGGGRRSSPLVRTGIALLVGLLITVIAVQVGLWWTGWDRPVTTAGQSADQPTDADRAAGRDWRDVIVDLDAARGRALAAADPALLADVYVQESPAAVADQQTIARLADQGLHVLDGRHEIVSATPVDAAVDAPNAPSVRLTVVDLLPTHPVVDAAGQQVGVTAGRSERSRVLVLTATDAGYRISEVGSG
jgi:hypothetical protein